jgi:tRNA U34 2-thiouridine synthase MnmA/TrmU
MGRNTPILKEIINALDSELDDTEYALDRLESHFHDSLLVNAGNVTKVSTFAEQLRLRVASEECSKVLDYIGEHQMVLITIDVVENAINELLGWDRFIEP